MADDPYRPEQDHDTEQTRTPLWARAVAIMDELAAPLAVGSAALASWACWMATAVMWGWIAAWVPCFGVCLVTGVGTAIDDSFRFGHFAAVANAAVMVIATCLLMIFAAL